MLQATWDWYYGSNEEEQLGDCQFGDPYIKDDKSECSNIIVRPGTYENGDSVNVFTSSQKDDSETSQLDKCTQHLKLLRHPNILRFVSCIPVELEYHLITEHAYPLQTLLDVVDAHEICNGLHDIALALQFIHEKAHITHNNVCIESIFVDDNGPWKLAGFNYACRFEEATEDHLNQISSYVPPPEEQGSNKVSLPLSDQYGYCRDVYHFGVLLNKFLDKVQFSTAMLKSALEDVIEDFTREDYENRPTVTEILTMPIFKSAYISIIHFLQSITLRSKTEKEDFFKSFLSKLDANHIFAKVIGRRIVPLLLTPIVLAEQTAVNHVIKTILTPASEQDGDTANGGILPESVFARYVIAKIVELFKSRLIHVRLILLENFSKFVHLFESSVLNDIVLPEILVGLHDANNQVVQFTLHAIADAVAVVGADVIVGEEREKIFSPGIPKFDGRALNESRALAYKEKIPARKKVEKKLPPPAPRKPTLLELAMLGKKIAGDSSAPSVEVLLKQKQFAHQIVAKSQVTSNGLSSHKSPNIHPRSHIVAQVVQQPDVEVWASSDEGDSDAQWPEIDGNSSLTRDTCDDSDSDFSHRPEKLRQPSNLKLSAKEKDSDRTKSRSADSSPHRSTDPRVKNGSKNEFEYEFEIKVAPALTAAAPKEPDFFADMEPEISISSRLINPSPSKSTPHLNHSGTNGLKSEDVKTPLTAVNTEYCAPDVDDEEGGGWNDDGFDWE